MYVSTEVIEGTLKPDGTLELDQKPHLNSGRVKVALQPADPKIPGRELADVIDAIRQDQLARGFHGRTAEEIEAGLSEGEDDYEHRMNALRS